MIEDEDIIESRIGPAWLSLNVRAFLRRLNKKPKIDPIGIVAQRFIQIFDEHGVRPTQITRFLPEITLGKLTDSKALLEALTPEVLDKVADLFKIRREWLDGSGNQIYDGRWCYKRPEIFLNDIARLDMNATLWPVIAICKDDKLDFRKNRDQPITLVLVEKITTIGEKEIDRYHIYQDDMSWDYWKCRIEIKALARIFYELHHNRIPIFRVSAQALKEISEGRRVPRHFLMRRLHNVSLEDFVFSSEESRVAKETEELPTIERYIEAYGLRERVGLSPREIPSDQVDPPNIYEFT